MYVTIFDEASGDNRGLDFLFDVSPPSCQLLHLHREDSDETQFPAS